MTRGRLTRPADAPWLWTPDAAAYVGLGIAAFRATVKRGEIAPISDAGHPRYLRADLDAYLQQKRPAPTTRRLTAIPSSDPAPNAQRAETLALIREHAARNRSAAR